MNGLADSDRKHKKKKQESACDDRGSDHARNSVKIVNA